MTFIVSILFVFIIISFINTKNFMGLLTLILLSLIADMFKFSFFGSKIIVYQFITLLYFPFILRNKIPKKILSIIKGLKQEYAWLLIFGILYGFIFPWDDGITLRTWSQKASGRTIVAVISILSNILLVYLTFLFFISKRVKLQKFLNIFSILIFVISIVSFTDLLFDYPIYKLLFGIDSISDVKNGRLLGLSIEPRSLGRWMVQGWFFLAAYKINGHHFKLSKASLIMGLAVIFFSFSFSTYFLFFISLILIFRNEISKIKFQHYFLVFLTAYLGLNYFAENKELYNIFKYKYEISTGVVVEEVLLNEPAFFTQFEIFDRAALNFFYNNPKHLIFGTGPNLISIPSSKYIDDSASKIFKGHLIGIPSLGLVNLLSRSGIIGLILYTILFIKVYKYLRKNELLKNIFLLVVLNFIFLSISWIYFSIGFLLAQQHNFNTHKNIKC